MLYHDHAQGCTQAAQHVLHAAQNTETDILVYGGNWLKLAKSLNITGALWGLGVTFHLILQFFKKNDSNQLNQHAVIQKL